MRNNIERVEQPFIQSFVVRCSLVNDAKTPTNKWRVKVTHVQNDEECIFHSMEDAYSYMKTMMGE